MSATTAEYRDPAGRLWRASDRQPDEDEVRAAELAEEALRESARQISRPASQHSEST